MERAQKPAEIFCIRHKKDALKTFLRHWTYVFSCGSLGGLINSVVVWLFGLMGITTALGVNIAPSFTRIWLYPRIVWGGLWGFLFLLPFLKNSYFFRGLLYSLGPTIAQLFIVFPIQAKKGVMGVDLGMMTPIFVLFFNALWGISTAFCLEFINPEDQLETKL